MKVEVDRHRCEGHAMCEVVAPDLFSVDDEGNVSVLVDGIATDDEPRAYDAMQACPVAALKLMTDG